MQLSLIEIARNVLNYQDANSSEFDANTTHKIIDYLPNQYKGIKLGGTMRLGEYDCHILKDTLAYSLYEKEDIKERHRHRYEFNNQYKKELCEIIELPSNKYFIACQFHPEFQSRPLQPHPLFKGLIKASLD